MGNYLYLIREKQLFKSYFFFFLLSTFSSLASPVDSTMNKTCISQLNLDLISLLCKADELECFHKDMNISILL